VVVVSYALHLDNDRCLLCLLVPNLFDPSRPSVIQEEEVVAELLEEVVVLEEVQALVLVLVLVVLVVMVVVVVVVVAVVVAVVALVLPVSLVMVLLLLLLLLALVGVVVVVVVEAEGQPMSSLLIVAHFVNEGSLSRNSRSFGRNPSVLLVREDLCSRQGKKE